MALAGGTINIGNDTLSITGSGYITGGTSTAYIIASGSGALGLPVTASGSGWISFPVGTSASFAPVSVQLNAGSSSAGTVYVTANSGVLAQGTAGASLSATQPVVDITWLVEPTLTNNINLNLMTMWSAGLQVNGFNPDSAFIAHYMNGSWNTSAVGSAGITGSGMYSMQLSDITSFSPFAVFGSHTTTGIAPVANEGTLFEVYPNPVSDNLIIKNGSNANWVNAEVIDINGQIVATYQLTNLTNNISLSNLSAGNYFLKLTGNNVNEVKKIIKL